MGHASCMADEDFPTLRCATSDEWDDWLRAHHAVTPGVFLQIAKRGSGIASLTAKEAVPVALAWGWIDGRANRIDDDWFSIRYTPRRPRSIWSKVNVAHVERLVAEGRMQPAGMAQVEAAKADGRWDAAYAGSASMAPPPELQAELDANPKAAAAFAALGSSARYAICFRIHNAKRAETKLRNARKYVGMLDRGEPIY